MAVARLLTVTLEAPKPEVGVLLAKLIRFAEFHPSKRQGMVQDIGLLLLASKAHDIYSRAVELLERGGIRTAEGKRSEVERFEAHDIEELLSVLADYLETIEKNLSLFTDERDRWGVTEVLLAIQEASLMVFNDLERIFTYPPDGGKMRFEGFVPANSVQSLKDLMGGYLVSVEPVRTNTKDVAYVPSLLVNPRLVSAFESLTLMRGLPRYGEVDPTPILAFVFPFFFGIMFADVGHGIALAAFGLYLLYRTTYKTWGKLVLVLSSSTALFGFIRGSFFGVTFHLASGYVIAFVNQERAGNYLDALLDRLPTVVLYSFLIPLGFAVAGTGLDLGVLFTSSSATPVFNTLLGANIPVAETARVSIPVVAATLAVLIAGRPIQDYLSTHQWRRAVRGLGAGLLGAVAKPLEFFMNTLSYVRLGVLLITTTLLGSLVADVLSFGVVGVPIAAFLNVAVITLEGVIVYLQDMRLQLYEWLSEFYAGTGTPFVPLVSGGGHFGVNWV
jgi:vacuolar-type H+-ATPase subunit I/STV1